MICSRALWWFSAHHRRALEQSRAGRYGGRRDEAAALTVEMARFVRERRGRARGGAERPSGAPRAHVHGTVATAPLGGVGPHPNPFSE